MHGWACRYSTTCIAQIQRPKLWEGCCLWSCLCEDGCRCRSAERSLWEEIGWWVLRQWEARERSQIENTTCRRNDVANDSRKIWIQTPLSKLTYQKICPWYVEFVVVELPDEVGQNTTDYHWRYKLRTANRVEGHPWILDRLGAGFTSHHILAIGLCDWLEGSGLKPV
jgi:hypothetical protein